METLDPNSSPNKRPKIETLTLISPIIPSSAKGKAPIAPYDDVDDEIPAQLPSQNCGICFTNEGKTARGLIDSCDHYFCFLCIIEWSKIDSRCPLCRGRFSSILRMRKDGSFIGSSSVPIPVRDQIYDAFGEPVDRYGEAKCSVCNGTKDECLLLLCDICDSGSHTYCVGLGATVPEDDWYCRDCDLLRAEQTDSGMDDDVEASPVPKQADEPEDGHDESVSIFDIVREPSEERRANSDTDRLLKLVSLNPTKFSSSDIVSDRPSSSAARNLPCAVGNLISLSNEKGSSARTLRKSREVHRHLNVLRENWDAFRTGSLTFSTKLSCPNGKASQKMNQPEKIVKESSPLQFTKSSQSKAHESSCVSTKNEQSYNIQRAWKLMNAAKSLQLPNKAKSVCKSSLKNSHDLKVDKVSSKCAFAGMKDLMSPQTGTRKPTKVNGSLTQSAGQRQYDVVPIATCASKSEYRNFCMPLKATRSFAPSKVQTMVQPNIYNNKASLASSRPIVGSSGVTCTNSHRPIISTLSGKQAGKLSANNKDEEQIFGRTDFCYDRARLSSRANTVPSLSKISSDNCDSAHTAFSEGQVAEGPMVSSVKLKEKQVSEFPKSDGPKIARKAGKDDEAKDEILSLVKLNLKLLCKEKRLESEKFKEIARLSTHTILAACGFEHRDIIQSIPALVCHHGNQTQRLHRSALVPSSCRDCFYTFVKDVVNSILSEKMNK